jgi:hypothetical protein
MVNIGQRGEIKARRKIPAKGGGRGQKVKDRVRSKKGEKRSISFFEVEGGKRGIDFGPKYYAQIKL